MCSKCYSLVIIVLRELRMVLKIRHNGTFFINPRRACAARVTVVVLCEGSATAEKSVRDFEFTERFQDFSNDFRFQPIQQKISRFQRRFQLFARISAEISRFHVISGEISRFQQRFHGSQRHAPWCRCQCDRVRQSEWQSVYA